MRHHELPGFQTLRCYIATSNGISCIVLHHSDLCGSMKLVVEMAHSWSHATRTCPYVACRCAHVNPLPLLPFYIKWWWSQHNRWRTRPYLSLLVITCPLPGYFFFCSRWWTRPYHRRHGTSRHLVPEGTVSLRGIQVVPEATRAHFESKARPWNMWKIWWIWNVDDL